MAPVILTNHQQAFKNQFFKCLGQNPKRIHIVVPYLGTFHHSPYWRDVREFAYHVRSMDCHFLLITRPPPKKEVPEGKSNLISIESAYAIEGWGGHVRFRVGATLHSKIYQFFFSGGRQAAFVGSANFSNNGFYTNDEIVAFSEEQVYNEDVASEISKLAKYSIDINNWIQQNVTS